MPPLSTCYPELVDLLARSGGSSPPNSSNRNRWEAVVRHVLSRAVVGKQVEEILAVLDAAGMLEPARLAAATTTEVCDLLAESGQVISPRTVTLLRRVAEWFSTAFPDRGRDDEIGQASGAASVFREQLRAINGVGPGTADAILLDLGYPSYPINPGIYRILIRHGWCDISADYDEASETLGRHAGGDLAETGLLVRGLSEVGRRFCGVRAPKCDRCPLLPLLPESGPIDPHG